MNNKMYQISKIVFLFYDLQLLCCYYCQVTKCFKIVASEITGQIFCWYLGDIIWHQGCNDIAIKSYIAIRTCESVSRSTLRMNRDISLTYAIYRFGESPCSARPLSSIQSFQAGWRSEYCQLCLSLVIVFFIILSFYHAIHSFTCQFILLYSRLVVQSLCQDGDLNLLLFN